MKHLFFYDLPGRKPTGRNCASRIKNKIDFEIISKNLVNARRTFQNIEFLKNGVSLKKETRFFGKNRPKISYKVSKFS